MKKIIFVSVLAACGFSGYGQTYQPITSKNKTYLETLKGVSYTYKQGVVTLKNNGKYALGTVSIKASSKVDSSLFGIALFEDGIDKGETVKADVYFTTGLGKNVHEMPLNQIDQKNLLLSFDKATRAAK
ncbi:hypothetical protein SAMN04488511_113140 [Pedobacter suwonensis]|uniref:Uncharacterized protein n=1 Tax=Pedobacter suwonensis TaxID=332999 RepID=A0A1I0TU54_9SPHI|nr:hypothetical protein [Pedobacter suwonensis]SFA54476.1 hypothetical protein SAMN04488511_113140 [Pedobacter suwonensis]